MNENELVIDFRPVFQVQQTPEDWGRLGREYRMNENVTLYSLDGPRIVILKENRLKLA